MYVFCVFVPPALMDALHALRCHIHASLDSTPITDAPYPRSSSGWEEIWSGMHAVTVGKQVAGVCADYSIGVLWVVH
jgi:hypothetical protein